VHYRSALRDVDRRGLRRDGRATIVRRILVKGASGAGKTTLGRALAQHIDVPYVELDALQHGPNWAEASAAELRAKVHAALNDDRGWVVDGNYEKKLGTTLLERAELIVWLDLPLATKLRRLVNRTLRRWIDQEELWNGNRESLRGVLWGREALFPWTIRCHFRHRREWPVLLRGHDVVRLRTTLDVETWASRFFTDVR
jgi:adenylate kinase family enzyme